MGVKLRGVSEKDWLGLSGVDQEFKSEWQTCRKKEIVQTMINIKMCITYKHINKGEMENLQRTGLKKDG